MSRPRSTPQSSSQSPDGADRSLERQVHRILSNPDLYPDEMKVWLPRFLERNAQFRLTIYQLPVIESTKYVADGGNPAFAGAWANFGAPYENAGFYKDSFGRIHLCGVVKSGSGTIFTLPLSYRPKNKESFIVTTTNTSATAGRIDVDSDGTVSFVYGTNTFVQLSGITFRAL